MWGSPSLGPEIVDEGLETRSVEIGDSPVLEAAELPMQHIVAVSHLEYGGEGSRVAGSERNRDKGDQMLVVPVDKGGYSVAGNDLDAAAHQRKASRGKIGRRW